MKILVEPSAHHLRNLGDVSMLQAAFERLSDLWPEAKIGVITDDPGRLELFCPGAVPVSANGRRAWLDEPYLGSRVHSALPEGVSLRLRKLEQSVRRRSPQIAAASLRIRRRIKGSSGDDLENFLAWANTADLLVASGAGLLTDHFAPLAVTVLELLESGIARGSSAAMFGQGVGPISDRRLATWIRRVGPRLIVIGIREDRMSRGTLTRLGVPDELIHTTGDDAIEQAFEARSPRLGSDVGFAIRSAPYAGMDERQLDHVASGVREAAARFSARLIPVPISFAIRERDDVLLSRLIGEEHDERLLVTPLELIKRLRQCRVVVAGSYHAGVFALGQGIPTVGLASSPYYVDKFCGLRDQFNGLSAVIRVDRPGFETELKNAVEEAWRTAESVRHALLESAGRQVEQSRMAYRRLREAVEGARRGDGDRFG
jgi:polysaccharide pyruvyl transferase WcaK-like protein